MHSHYVAMNMFITKIFLKPRKCLNRLLILILAIIVLGGVKVISHINNKNMRKLVISSKKRYK